MDKPVKFIFDEKVKKEKEEDDKKEKERLDKEQNSDMKSIDRDSFIQCVDYFIEHGICVD